MTAVGTPATSVGSHAFAPGTKGFVAVLSLCMATTALAIDTVLPAYGEIREHFDLASNATEVTGLITFYLMGNSIGLLPAGLLADRFGRRAVMWGGLALYLLGAVASIAAPTLTLMFAARFVWGLASAGPRVAAMAMIRDGFSGEQMAKQMSLIMAVFLLIPAVGPSISTGILAIGPWQLVFWMCALVAVGVAFLVGGLPETLPETSRRPLAARGIWTSIRTVLTTPGTIGYLASLTALFGIFMSYLSTSELIIDQTYGLEPWFPVFFGGIALVMLVAMLVNGRFVERIGLTRWLGMVFAANIVSIAVLLLAALATGGQPHFAVFVVGLASVLFFQQMLIPNLNAAAMRPLADVAGTGAAILGMVSGTLGAVIAELMNRQFDGTIRPLTLGFATASAIAVVSWRWADRASPA